MTTINISLPEKLKEQAQTLVERGFYASFSDLVRDSIRELIAENRYNFWFKEAREDLKSGRARQLRNKKEIDEYIKSL